MSPLLPYRRTILIYDTDSQLLEQLRRDPRTERFPLLAAQSPEEARVHLENQYNLMAGVFFNPATPVKSWQAFLLELRTRRPGTPVFMLLEPGGRSKLGTLDIRKFGIREATEKPIDYQVLLEIVKPIALGFDAEEALRKARESQAADSAGSAPPQDADFVAIRAEDFLSGTLSYFDVYVRLASGRHLKLLQAGDVFERERLETYLSKGVRHFYIRKEVQDVYVSYTTQLATALIQHKVAPMELKAKQALNQGDQVMSFLSSQGLNDSSIQFAERFTENLTELTRQMKLEQNPLFNGFMESTGAYDHGVSTGMLAGLLARELDITYSRSVQIVGMAALLHDIALQGSSEKLRAHDVSSMNPGELELLEAHPERGAEMVSLIKGVDSAVVQAIRQHHMRAGGEGYPERPVSQKISLIAEIVGICSEFDLLLRSLDAREDRALAAPMIMEEKVIPRFSRAVGTAFRSAFYPKDAPI